MFASKQAFYIFFIQILALQLLFADTSRSQSIKKVKINIHLEDARLTDVLNTIEQKTEFAFIYDENVIESKERFSLDFDDISVADILKKVGAQSGLNFKQINTNISVTKVASPKAANHDKEIARPDITIAGNVTDENGQPLPGATVQVKGTAIGTVTQVNGSYTLTVPDDSETLVFSYIGYITEEVSFTGQVTINMVLYPDVTQLGEVVVTALGVETNRREVGYTVQEIQGSEIAEVKDPNFLNNLSGRVAGVQVINGPTGVGSSSRITIRGESSFNNNSPLFVVDGIPINNQTVVNLTTEVQSGVQEADFGNGAAEINPDDIESVSILKGPTAAALYGSRGGKWRYIDHHQKGDDKKGLGISVNSTFFAENAFRFPDFQNAFGQGSFGGSFAFEDGIGAGINDGSTQKFRPPAE